MGEIGWIPACAGMTEARAGTYGGARRNVRGRAQECTGEAIGVLESGWQTLGVSHPPPNLPPGRGEG